MLPRNSSLCRCLTERCCEAHSLQYLSACLKAWRRAHCGTLCFLCSDSKALAAEFWGYICFLFSFPDSSSRRKKGREAFIYFMCLICGSDDFVSHIGRVSFVFSWLFETFLLTWGQSFGGGGGLRRDSLIELLRYLTQAPRFEMIFLQLLTQVKNRCIRKFDSLLYRLTLNRLAV